MYNIHNFNVIPPCATPTNKIGDNKLMLCNNNILPTLKGNNCHFFCINTNIKKRKVYFVGVHTLLDYGISYLYNVLLI